MSNIKVLISLLLTFIIISCNKQAKKNEEGKEVILEKESFEIFETSQSGNKLTKLAEFSANENAIEIKIKPENKFQVITGFGGSFTESSAYLLNNLSKKNRDLVLNAYFGSDGARYSLTRTHINSCDFSLSNYSYASVAGDKNLNHFSIDPDRDDIIPMIKDAMAISEDGFKIISSPWTAPPWMKDNKDWKGGKLLPEYYETWALFFSKYLDAYKKEGINIWGITVENEPLGNGSNWESMHFSPEEMNTFISEYLGPKLESDQHNVKLLAYDQNRGEELIHWANLVYKDDKVKRYVDGMAIHWYASTFDWFPKSLNITHELAPDKYLIHSEGCVDSEVPHWKNDDWYWSKEATDWGYDWAPADQKKLHPKYVPVYRYARNIIGSLNNWVDGWIDWNMVLDERGGPNWANNWCIAPVIVDTDIDEVYFTPLYYTMAHFSKFIRPKGFRIGHECKDNSLMVTAVHNIDGSFAVIVLNMNMEAKNLVINLGEKSINSQISAQAIQTILIQQ